MSPCVRIKFCGLTRAQDVAHAVELGVDFIGLVFAARSPRRLDLARAQVLRGLIPKPVQVVALVMDNTAGEIAAIIEAVRPDVIQFHGAETDHFCTSFGLPFFKAIALGGPVAPDPGERALHWPSARALLFDGHGAGEPGGSGQTFDWKLLARGIHQPFLLAGGLHPGNLARAISTARPWGVDVSSGIESAPGIKSRARMEAFVAAARRMDA